MSIFLKKKYFSGRGKMVSLSIYLYPLFTKCSSRKDFQPTEHINNSKKEPTVVGYSRKESLLKYCSSEEEIEKNNF